MPQAEPPQPQSQQPAGVASALWRHPQANGHVVLQHGGQALRVAYHWQGAQRRSVGMRVSALGLQVRAPHWLGEKQLEAILQGRARWLIGQWQAMQAERHSAPGVGTAPVWAEGCGLVWQGQLLRIALGLAGRRALLQPLAQPVALASGAHIAGRAAWLGHAQGRDEADRAGQVLHLPLRHDASASAIAQAAQHWLRAQAMALLQQRCAHFAPLMGVAPRRLALTNAQTRWGSASARGDIRLHWRLAQCAPQLFDYVLVHELAHLHEMNHGPRFWAWVERIQPDYAQHRARLRQLRFEPWDGG
ncbi:M48 family peptidase [Vandammella animalimorsus]|uniref:M48 family peptidase n=1 Tax=Vandammella animalimorsus TaxID=2029117 RepID=A0A3M6RVN5_9BURK|nr:SprT family zinc-dependent metalloprotease [Vandammella animalimorsus]RMX18915.1 M48 family peptidase [Vandammella animalimorsus]